MWCVSTHVAFTVFRKNVRLSIMGGVRLGFDSVGGLINAEYNQTLVSINYPTIQPWSWVSSMRS
jgi:hypothetical protein